MFAIIDKSTLVSIIIPCFNAELYIGEAIESALEQTHAPVEVIVIDDGSTDNSVAKIRLYSNHIYYETRENHGPSVARNRGLAIAKGSFIQFLDADDILMPKKIEMSLNIFNQDIGVVFTDMEDFFDNRKAELMHHLVANIVKPLRERSAVWNNEDILESVLRMAIGTPLPLHRREILLLHGGFREDLRILEDVELAFRLALSGVNFVRINEKLVRVRKHRAPTRLRLTPGNNILALKALYCMHEQALKAERLSAGVKDALADQFANHGRKAFRLGYSKEAETAFQKALLLKRNPKPTGVPIYNCLSRIFGLIKTENMVLSIENKIKAFKGGIQN